MYLKLVLLGRPHDIDYHMISRDESGFANGVLCRVAYM